MNDRYEGPSLPTYRCQASRNCQNLAFRTIREVQAIPELGFRAGLYACELHTPRICRHCGHAIPWYDGSVCDRCDRYDDDGGADE